MEDAVSHVRMVKGKQKTGAEYFSGGPPGKENSRRDWNCNEDSEESKI